MLWHGSVVTSASHFCDQLLLVYKEHDPTVVVTCMALAEGQVCDHAN